jgi:hypothetical protein
MSCKWYVYLAPSALAPLILMFTQHPELAATTKRWLIGRVAALIHDIKPAQQIIDEMVGDAAEILNHGGKMVQAASMKAKL